MVQLNGSIVLYHNKKEQLIKTINCFLNTDLKVKLYLVDNSSNDRLKELMTIDSRIEYIYNNTNLGYGTAHNIAMRKSILDGVAYHLVLNPDIYFDSAILLKLYEYMQAHQSIGHLMPKVLYPDGKNQNLCKLLPSPLDLFVRRFIPIKSLVKNINERYELNFFDYSSIEEIPFLSGCFMFLRTKILEQNCLFDESFFMYLEDADLTRRISKVSKTIFYPKETIYHEYYRGAHKNKKLMWFFIKSTFTYFNKYGWVFDSERRNINNKVLKKLKYN